MVSEEDKVLAKSSVLYASAREIAKNCGTENANYLKCKAKDEDPAACIKEAGKVQNCVIDTIKSMNTMCPKEFVEYSKCLEWTLAEEYIFDRCRPQQANLESCRAEKK